MAIVVECWAPTQETNLEGAVKKVSVQIVTDQIGGNVDTTASLLAAPVIGVEIN